MSRFTHVAGLLLLSASAASAQVAATASPGAEAPRPMTVDDALDLVVAGDGLMSPDGQRVLFSKTRLDWDENERKVEHHMVSASGGESWQYLNDEGGSAFQFSPDGRYLTFLRTVSGKSGGEGSEGAAKGKAGNEKKRQLFWMRTAGGEALQLTKHATSVQAYQWADDSSAIFFSALDERPEKEDEALKAGADVVFVNEGPNGQDLEYWSNLWKLDLESKETAKLTDERFVLGEFDPSPDGSKVALTARYRNRRNDADLTEIFLLDVESKEKVRLTENQAPEGGVQWAPNGELFVFTAADDEKWLNRNTKIWLMDPSLREHSLISGAFEGSISDVVWSPDSETLYFNGQQGTSTNLFRMDVRSGALQKLTDVEGSIQVSSWSRDRRRFVYSYSDADSPEDLYAGDLEGDESAARPHGPGVASVRLTDLNPQLAGLQLGQMKVIRWTSHDGREIEGLLHLPVGYQEGTRYPLMLNIHGGPAGVFPNSWRALYHVYSGLGYVSLSPNVRGSSGYTDDLREGNTTEKGDGIGLGDFQDLMTGVDHLIEQGIADPERLALRGWSYGGILGGWTITHTDRFKAASIGAGVYDWTSEYGPGFNHDVRLWHIGGTPWDNPEGYREQSALTHVANARTATILFHGAADTTDTEQQSMMMFTALQEIAAAPVRYIKFPRQPHGIREPRHIRIRDIEEIRWMQKHVLGEEWTPWERKPAKEKDEKKKKDADGES